MNLLFKSLASLFFALTLTSCGGGSSGSSPATSVVATSANVLFVPDTGQGVIAAFPTLDAAPGTTLQGNLIAVKSWQGNNVQYDSLRDDLYAADGTPALVKINVYGAASKAGAGVTPSRSFSLPPDVISVNRLIFDKASNTLYVGASRTYSGVILVFRNASSLTGVATPDRTIILSGLSDFALDLVRNIAYVNNGISGIGRVPNIDTVSGVQPLTPNIFSFISSGVAVDVIKDRLYVSDVFNGVHIVTQASTVNPTLLGTLAIANARLVSFDPNNDRLYVSAYQKAYVVNTASVLTATSTISATTAVSIPNAVSIGGFGFP